VINDVPIPDFERVFDQAPAAFLLLTCDLVIVHANRALLEAAGTTLEDTVGRSLLDVFPMNPDDAAADGLRNLTASLAQVRDTKQPHIMAIQKYDLPRADGTYEERYWSPRSVPIFDDRGEVVLLLHRSDDITDYVSDRDAGVDGSGASHPRQRSQEVEFDLFARTHELQDLNRQLHLARDELAERALHDPLTGLLVRSVLLEQLAHNLARLERHAGDVAVLFIDLDGLKQVNDTYGHAAGDALIRCGAQRLRSTVRPSDTVARIGGDEFVVLLDELDEGDVVAGAVAVAQRLLAALDPPCPVTPELSVRPRASIGIATASNASSTGQGDVGETGARLKPDARARADELLSCADAAMYEAKRGGGGRYQLFDEAAHGAMNARLHLTAELRAALPASQLRLHYQPIIDLSSGATYGVEALLRWEHPDGRLRAAAEFIDVAQQAGLLSDIGGWVITEGCRQLAAWTISLGARAPQRMFLNVSAAELSQPRLHEHLGDTTRALRLDPQRLVLEVTETGMLDAAGSAATLAALKELGCKLAIDDFGTGHSSLSRLVQLPANFLKIDRSFVRDLHRDQHSVAIIAAVLTLAHNLRKVVIAEGVEDAASLATLQDLGCSYAQGYHLASPQPPDQLRARLADQPHEPPHQRPEPVR